MTITRLTAQRARLATAPFTCRSVRLSRRGQTNQSPPISTTSPQDRPIAPQCPQTTPEVSVLQRLRVGRVERLVIRRPVQADPQRGKHLQEPHDPRSGVAHHERPPMLATAVNPIPVRRLYVPPCSTKHANQITERTASPTSGWAADTGSSSKADVHPSVHYWPLARGSPAALDPLRQFGSKGVPATTQALGPPILEPRRPLSLAM